MSQWNNNMKPHSVYTLQHAKEHLGATVATIKQWIQTGFLRAYRHEGNIVLALWESPWNPLYGVDTHTQNHNDTIRLYNPVKTPPPKR